MFKLREVTNTDIQLIFEWANDADARNMAINSSSIKWEDHLDWFQKKLNDNNCFFYILKKDMEDVGVIRFDKNEIDEFTISYYIDANYRGEGLGFLILKLGMEKIESLCKMGKFVACVKDSNRPSSKIFLKNNFLKKREEILNNSLFFIYEKDLK